MKVLVRFKSLMRRALQAMRLRIALRHMAALPPGTVPGRDLLVALHSAWGNPGYSAVVEYLEAVCRLAATTQGSILECGSGITTLLLGLVAGRRGIEIVSLEHDARWHARVASVLRTLRIPQVRLVLAPLQDRGTFTWYGEPPGGWPSALRLVICDGPPSSTPGGRYGLFPVVRQSLQPGAVILLDDTARPEEQEVLHRWSAEQSLQIEYLERPNGSFAAVTVL